MWLNMKPYSDSDQYSSIKQTSQYSLSITDKRNHIDHKRNIIYLRPGHQTYIKVLPRIVNTSESFEALTLAQRKCKMPYETDGLMFVTNFTRVGCELECAAQLAVDVCKCIPWYFPNNFTYMPMCDMFGGHCFDRIISEETNYKRCPELCLEDCQEMSLTLLPNIIPINYDQACSEGSFHFEHFRHSFAQHCATMQ